MNFRKAIFWLHLFCGVLAGIVVLIMSITGVALTYQKQMTAWADKRVCGVQASVDTAPLSAAALIERFREARPGINPAGL